MKILYGTTNKGKLQAMKTAVESLVIELIGLGDIDELQEEEQPGLHVRRINGKELTDDEMIIIMWR